MSLRTKVANLSIRPKIFASFVAVLPIVGGLGGMALTRFAAIQGAVVHIADAGLPSVAYVDTMRVSFATFGAVTYREILMADDPAVRRATRERAAGLVQAYEDAEAKYEPLVDPGTETVLYAAVTAASAAYMDIYDRLQVLLDAGRIADAKVLAQASMLPASAKFDAALTAIVDFNLARVQTDAADVAGLYRTGRAFVEGSVVFAVLLSGLACLFLIGGIAAPIRAMAGAMANTAARRQRQAGAAAAAQQAGDGVQTTAAIAAAAE